MVRDHDPIRTAQAHQTAILGLLEQVKANQSCLQRLLVKRRVTSTRRPGPIWTITEVKCLGAGVEVWGVSGKSGKRLLGRSLHEIATASMADAPSMGEPVNEQS